MKKMSNFFGNFSFNNRKLTTSKFGYDVFLEMTACGFASSIVPGSSARERSGRNGPGGDLWRLSFVIFFE